MRQVLVTGATGFVGRVFTRAPLDEYPDLHVWALVRGKDGAPPARRPELRDLAGNPRLHVVEGDLTQVALGAGPAAIFGPRHRANVVADGFHAGFHFAGATNVRASHEHRHRIRRNNPLLPTKREIRRRTDVVLFVRRGASAVPSARTALCAPRCPDDLAGREPDGVRTSALPCTSTSRSACRRASRPRWRKS